jgi:hypothetical protein
MQSSSLRPLSNALLIGTLIACALSACSKQSTTSTPDSKAPENAGATAPAKSKDSAPSEKKAEAAAAVPKGDAATPLASYRLLDSGNQIMFLYYGLLNLPVDYEKIAGVYSAEYRDTSDSFKKKDVLTALTPRIDQEIAKAKTSRYVRMDDKGGSLLSRYDFSKKAFAIPSLSDNSGYNYFYDNAEFKVNRGNATSFSYLNVPDETKARAIEGYLSKGEELKLEIYSFAQDADPSNHQVKLQIMKVRLLSPTGEALVEQ